MMALGLLGTELTPGDSSGAKLERVIQATATMLEEFQDCFIKWPFIMLLNSHLCNQMADDRVCSCCEGLPRGQHSSWALRLSAAPIQNLSRPAESLPLPFVRMDKHLQSEMLTSPGRTPLATVHPFVLKVTDHFPLSVGDSEVKG